jgi:hypothetical protein
MRSIRHGCDWRTALVCGLLAWLGTPGQAQTRSVEREEFLFVVNPPPASKGAVTVVWIPQPMQRYCLGRTLEQCVAIDFCLRTTSREVQQCRNLPVDVAKIPRYSRDLYPRRVLSVIYFRAATAIKGVGDLLEYYDSQPRSDFDRLSLKARIRARINVKRSADDDEFDLLEVLQAPVL